MPSSCSEYFVCFTRPFPFPPPRLPRRSFRKLGDVLSKHPDKRLLFNTQTVVAKGVDLMLSFREALQEATGVTYRGGNSPSSGLVAAMIAAQLCSSVTLYGFGLGNCLRNCPRYHYWSKGEGPERGSQTSYKGHQYDVEGWLFQVGTIQFNSYFPCRHFTVFGRFLVPARIAIPPIRHLNHATPRPSPTSRLST